MPQIGIHLDYNYAISTHYNSTLAPDQWLQPPNSKLYRHRSSPCNNNVIQTPYSWLYIDWSLSFSSRKIIFFSISRKSWSRLKRLLSPAAKWQLMKQRYEFQALKRMPTPPLLPWRTGWRVCVKSNNRHSPWHWKCPWELCWMWPRIRARIPRVSRAHR